MATITGSTNNSRYTLTCEYSYTQNTSANTSTITAIVYLAGNGYTTSSSYWCCTINGTEVTTNKKADINAKTELGRRTWTVNHNSDGTARVDISFSFSNRVTAGTYTVSRGSGSASVTLNTIPRASSISLNRGSATIGSDSVTVNISRASSNFTHKVKVGWGGTWYLLAENVAPSYSFTPPMSYCSTIPNATSGTATVKVETVSNGSWIGEATKTITFNVPNSVVPSVGISVTANNTLSGTNIANKTTFTVKPTNATGSYGSTIKSYQLSGGFLNSTSSSGATTGTLGTGDYTLQVKVTDSRGRTATASQKVTVYAYDKPTVSMTVKRANADGSANSEGTYVAGTVTFNVSNPNSKNANAKQYALYKKTRTASSWTTVTDFTNLSAYNGTLSINFGTGFAINTSYDVRVAIKDTYNTVTYDTSVSTKSALLNLEKNGVGIGKIWEQGALDVGGNVFVNGIIKANGDGKSIQLGTGGSDVYVHNTSSGKYLQLKDSGAMSYTGDWSLAYGTALYGNISEGTANRRIAKIASHGGVDLGDTNANIAICSANAPTWWNGSKSYTVYTSGSKPTPADIGASKALTTANGYQGFTLNDGTTSNWIRTTTSGIIPYQTANSSWNGANSSLGTSSWRFSNGYIKEIWCNGLKNDLGDLWLSSNVNNSNSTIYIQTKWLCPADTVYTYLGSSGHRWHSVWAAIGAIQTTDERFKVKQGFTDIEECYEMIKDTDIYNYIMLNQNKEDLSKNRLGKLALSSSQEQVNVHMGVMAQDIQKYKCSKQILVEGEYERANGSTDTMLSINPYGLTTAIMGALKVEIQKRETLEKELKQLKEEFVNLKPNLNGE